MLKLIKYDFMKVRSLIVIFGVIGLAINGLLFIFYKLKESFDASFLNNSVGILATFAVLFLFSLPVFILIVSIMLYSTDISKKKGYMTFLTPHSAYAIIGSKIILSLIIMICAVIVELLFITADFDLFFASNGEDLGIIYIAKVLFEALKRYPGQIALLLITAIIQWVTNILSFYVAIAISYSIVRKGKINTLVAVAVWIGIVVIEGIIAQVGSLVFPSFGLSFDANSTNTGIEADIAFPTEVFIFSIIVYAVIGTIMYFVTSYLTEKKISM